MILLLGTVITKVTLAGVKTSLLLRNKNFPVKGDACPKNKGIPLRVSAHLKKVVSLVKDNVLLESKGILVKVNLNLKT